MADIVLPQVDLINSSNNSTNLIVEQGGQINRLNVETFLNDNTVSNAETLQGHSASYFATAAGLSTTNQNISNLSNTVDNKIININNEMNDINNEIDDIKQSLGDGIKLNYSVVGGTTQPTSPTENMIWINTNTAITKYTFAKYQPKGSIEGEVWIRYNDKGTLNAFSQLVIGNGYLNYTVPILTEQYINGSWVIKDVLIYQNNAWHEWWDNSNIWSNENSQDNINGGYSTDVRIVFSGSYATAGTPIMQFDENGVWTIGTDGINQNFNVIFNNKIDLTNYSTLKFRGQMVGQSTDWTNIGIYSKIDNTNLTTGMSSNRVAVLSGGSNYQDYSLDISGLSGEYYIALIIFCTSGSANQYNIVMEKLWLE